MAKFNDFIPSIQVLSRDVAKFYRVVLHSHSPGSHDYGRNLEGVLNSTVFLTEADFENSILSSKLDLLAITDHMKCNYGCRVSEAAAKKGKCVLPGMEVNLRPDPPFDSFRIHITTIFPEGYSLEQITKMLPRDMPSEKDRNGNEEVTGALKDFVSKVHEFNGICIAAHIDSDKGIRKTFRQLGRDGITFCATDEKLTPEEEKAISVRFKEFLLKAGFDAIEVADCNHKVHYHWTTDDDTISIPVLLTNDAHRPEDLEIESRHTHIKMTTPGYEDLKLALTFPDTRIRFPTDVPSSPCPRILGLQIVSGGTEGFFKKVDIAFSDNLSCLIGPRGSGKSAVVESLRYVFGLNQMLVQLDHSGTDLSNKVKDLQKATLSNCIVRVLYLRADGQTHVLESSFDPKQDYTTKIYDAEGNDLGIHDLNATGAYPLRLFGWSEIETLGREPERQRDLLDRLIPDFSTLVENRSVSRQTLNSKRLEIESSASRLAGILVRNGGEIRRFKEFQADFARLNTLEIDQLFADIDTAKAQLALLNQVKLNVQGWRQDVINTADRDLNVGITELLAQSNASIQDWWTDNPIHDQIEERRTKIKSALETALGELDLLDSHVQSLITGVTAALQQKEKELREKVGGETTKQVAIDMRTRAAERLDEVNKLRTEYNREWVTLQDHLNVWKSTCDSLVGAQHAITEARQKQKNEIEAKLNLYTTPDMAISLAFRPGGDRQALVASLDENAFLAKKGLTNYKANFLSLRLSLLCTPVELATALLANNIGPISQSMVFDGKQVTVEKATAELLVASSYPFANDIEAEVETVDKDKLSSILEITEAEWDDDERITLNGKQVNSLSPGQRSSAMLPLIALAENAPLIIDQPEDNLDNKLVGKVLVDILTNLKEHRQIIVTTHNPNIVVSGDAEQVIVLDAISDHEGKCVQSASIDKGPIVQAVIDIMEGGKEAFRNRQRRYGKRVY